MTIGVRLTAVKKERVTCVDLWTLYLCGTCYVPYDILTILCTLCVTTTVNLMLHLNILRSDGHLNSFTLRNLRLLRYRSSL